MEVSVWWRYIKLSAFLLLLLLLCSISSSLSVRGYQEGGLWSAKVTEVDRGSESYPQNQRDSRTTTTAGPQAEIEKRINDLDEALRNLLSRTQRAVSVHPRTNIPESLRREMENNRTIIKRKKASTNNLRTAMNIVSSPPQEAVNSKTIIERLRKETDVDRNIDNMKRAFTELYFVLGWKEDEDNIISEKIQELQRCVEDLERIICHQTKRIRSQRARIGKLRVEKEKQKREMEALKREIEEKTTEIEEHKEEKEEQMTEIVELKTEIEEKTTEIEEQSEEIEEQKTEIVELNREIERLQLNINASRGCLTQSGREVVDGMIYYDGCQKFLCCQGTPKLLSSAGTTTTTGTEAIPHGFRNVSDSCYLPVDDWKSWNEAQTECQNRGSILAKPPSDFQEFRKFLRKIDDGYWWLGGKLINGDFIYPEHNNTSVESNDWTSGRPQSGDCLSLRASTTSPLYDVDCTNTFNFVCQLV